MHTHGHRLPPCTKQKRGIPAPAAKHKTYICEDIRHAHKRTHTHSQRHTHTHTHTLLQPTTDLKQSWEPGRLADCGAGAAPVKQRCCSFNSLHRLVAQSWPIYTGAWANSISTKNLCVERLCVCVGVCVCLFIYFFPICLCVWLRDRETNSVRVTERETWRKEKRDSSSSSIKWIAVKDTQTHTDTHKHT